MTFVLQWIIFGALFGSIGSYLLYQMLYRDEEAQQAALIGTGVGVVGGPILLIPMWAYWYMKLRGAPSVAVVPDQTKILTAPPLSNADRVWLTVVGVILFGAALILLSVYASTSVLVFAVVSAVVGSVVTPYIYQIKGRDPWNGAVVGAVLGVFGSILLVLLLWFVVPDRGKKCPDCGEISPYDALTCKQCKHEFAVETLVAPVSESQKGTFSIGRALIYVFLIFMVLVYLMPVYTVVTTSFKERTEAGRLDKTKVWEPPTSLHFEGYEEAWDVFGSKFRNSFVLTFSATFLSAVMGSLNGYVLAKWRFPGANIIFPLMLFGMFIPYQSILIPLFQFIDSINLGGPLQGLILVHVVYGLPITTLIFRNYYAEVPTEMLEAGSIDGAGFFGLYFRIVFPLSLPGFVVVIIWQFTQIWNELLFALVLTSGTGADPITVKLAELAGGEAVAFNVVMSGAVLAALPTLLVYIVLGRYFIRGLLAGSVKG